MAKLCALKELPSPYILIKLIIWHFVLFDDEERNGKLNKMEGINIMRYTEVLYQFVLMTWVTNTCPKECIMLNLNLFSNFYEEHLSLFVAIQ